MIGQVAQIVLIPLIGAGIGWITNVIAIRLLFRPRQPYRIPILGYEIQGLLPKRRLELARDIGRVVENELLSLEDVLNRINTSENQQRIVQAASTQVVNRVRKSIPDLVPRSLVRLVEEQIDTWLQRELPPILDDVILQIYDGVYADIQISEIVENKIHAFELDKLEVLIYGVAAKELRHIEVLGAILGFLIGLVQVGVFYLFQ